MSYDFMRSLQSRSRSPVARAGTACCTGCSAVCPAASKFCPKCGDPIAAATLTSTSEIKVSAPASMPAITKGTPKITRSVTAPTPTSQASRLPKAAAARTRPVLESRTPVWAANKCVHSNDEACQFCQTHTSPKYSTKRVIFDNSGGSSRGRTRSVATLTQPEDIPPPAPQPAPETSVITLPAVVAPPPIAHRGIQRHMKLQVHERFRTLRHAFEAFDTNCDGVISPKEFERAVRETLGMAFVTRPQCASLLAQCDTNKDGVIDMQEFQAFFRKDEGELYDADLVRLAISKLKSHLEARYHTMRNAFQALEHQHTGFLHTADFRRILRATCLSLNDRELNALVQRFDTNEDGHVSHAEFLRIMAC